MMSPTLEALNYFERVGLATQRNMIALTIIGDLETSTTQQQLSAVPKRLKPFDMALQARKLRADGLVEIVHDKAAREVNGKRLYVYALTTKGTIIYEALQKIA